MLESSGNIFKDLGHRNPEVRLAKTDLAIKINLILQKRKLKQTEVAEILGVSQSTISLLRKGIVSGFSLEKLIFLLKKLGQEIEIVIHYK